MEVETGHGFGQPFEISFWMPPPDEAFTISTDSPPEIQELPEDYTVLFEELVEKTWEFTVSDDGATAPIITMNTGSALSFLSVNIDATGKVTIKLLPDKVGSGGTYPIEVKAIDDAGQETSESFSIIIIEELPIFIPEAKKNSTNQTLEEEDEIKPIEAWIESISATGLMEIRFSDPVIPFGNITNITDQDYFLILKQLSDEED